jgi:hypothetical protein
LAVPVPDEIFHGPLRGGAIGDELRLEARWIAPQRMEAPVRLDRGRERRSGEQECRSGRCRGDEDDALPPEGRHRACSAGAIVRPVPSTS